MRLRAPALALSALLALSGVAVARASDEASGPGLRLNAWGLGLRLELDARSFDSRLEAPRHEPYRSVPLSVHAPQQGLRFSAGSGPLKEGWQAFGTFGPMRWAKTLDDDSDMSLRLGGRPAGSGRLPGKLNVGIQYRF
jgi:hypothetical protein